MSSAAPPAPRATLLCLPPAGTGRLAFADWPERIGDYAVEPVLYPGRDSRVSEPLATSVADLVGDVLRTHGAAIAGGRFALLGRSVGAALAMHVVDALIREELPLPRHVVLVAARPPQRPDPESPLFRLSDRRLRERIADWGGMSADELADDELMSWTLRLVRADLAVAETALSRAGTIPVSLTVVGAKDDRSVPVDVLSEWESATTAQFAWHVLPGGHFPDAVQHDLLVNLVADTLRESESKVMDG